MTLESIYYIGQTVAVVVIIATLIAVLIQMRQAHRLAKLETSRAIWVEASVRTINLADDAAKADFLQRALFGDDKLTDAEKTRLYLHLSGLMTMFENAFAMEQSGMMERRFWPRMRISLRDYVAPARGQRWWEIARKRTFSANPEFVSEVDSILVEFNALGENQA